LKRHAKDIYPVSGYDRWKIKYPDLQNDFLNPKVTAKSGVPAVLGSSIRVISKLFLPSGYKIALNRPVCQ